MKSVSVNLAGGLGNVLFQIATGYVTSLKNDMNFCVDLSKHHGGHHCMNKYFSNILRKIEFCDFFNHDYIFGESSHEYSEIPKLSANTKLNGYFQSEKYFVDFRNEILELFSPTEEITNLLNNKFREILIEDNCSIHVRRGDYVSLPDYYVNLTIDYYKKCVDEIGNDKLFLIFSDDIEWCKDNFYFIKNKIFVDNLEDYESLYLMSLCKNNIISNSTFGWWGAWMNQNNEKIVISSSEWFGPKLNHLLNSKDINCENWIKI